MNIYAALYVHIVRTYPMSNIGVALNTSALIRIKIVGAVQHAVTNGVDLPIRYKVLPRSNVLDSYTDNSIATAKDLIHSVE